MTGHSCRLSKPELLRSSNSWSSRRDARARYRTSLLTSSESGVILLILPVQQAAPGCVQYPRLCCEQCWHASPAHLAPAHLAPGTCAAHAVLRSGSMHPRGLSCARRQASAVVLMWQPVTVRRFHQALLESHAVEVRRCLQAPAAGHIYSCRLAAPRSMHLGRAAPARGSHYQPRVHHQQQLRVVLLLCWQGAS